MASRNFQRMQSLTREVKHLHAKVSIGASGAPTLDSNISVGIASISRDSAGVYVLTLDDAYNALVDFSVMQIAAAAEDLTFQIESEAVASTKTIQFQCKAADVETDPSEDSVLLIKVALKNTSVPR